MFEICDGVTDRPRAASDLLGDLINGPPRALLFAVHFTGDEEPNAEGGMANHPICRDVFNPISALPIELGSGLTCVVWDAHEHLIGQKEIH